MKKNELVVEIGRTKVTDQEIADLEVGRVFELGKKADEPVDVVVNEKLVAKGKVVILDGNFGVRIEEVIFTE